ncbi:MAG: type II secretion system protein [Phycisphaerales bacterium]
MKTKRSGLTVIEIMVVVGIMALLVGLLLPAVHSVQKMAKDTKQRAQLTAIELGLAAFKNDYGDYPPSNWWDPSTSVSGMVRDYCGAQKLAEALLGWDLMGFHPDSAWRSDGLDANKTANSVYWEKTVDVNALKKRKGRYIELESANAFLLGGGVDALFPGAVDPLAQRTYVLCDVYPVTERKVRMSDGKMVSPGTPILYYRANPANLLHNPPSLDRTSACVYDARDDIPLINLGQLADATKATRDPHWLAADVKAAGFDYFYDYIRDRRLPTTATDWPYRPDSYLLISAGMDGIYGTDDDIRNFGN